MIFLQKRFDNIQMIIWQINLLHWWITIDDTEMVMAIVIQIGMVITVSSDNQMSQRMQ